MWHYFPSRLWPMGFNISPHYCYVTLTASRFYDTWNKNQNYDNILMLLVSSFNLSGCQSWKLQNAKRVDWKERPLNGINVKERKNTEELEFFESRLMLHFWQCAQTSVLTTLHSNMHIKSPCFTLKYFKRSLMSTWVVKIDYKVDSNEAARHTSSINCEL